MRWLVASPTRWTWVWAGSGSRWWTGKPGVLQSMGSQRLGHARVTQLIDKTKVRKKSSLTTKVHKWVSRTWYCKNIHSYSIEIEEVIDSLTWKYLLYLYYLGMDFPSGSMVKNQPVKEGYTGSYPGLGRSPEEWNGNPTHSSILAWEIPWREDPGGLWFMGSQRVGHDWATDWSDMISSKIAGN